jgi:hypothetical protein
MSRPITIIALVQTLVTLICFLILLATFKVHGYPDTVAVRWNPVPLFLREHGTWFFLVPVFWVSYACYALQIDRGWMSFKIAQVVGISIILKRKMGALVDPF